MLVADTVIVSLPWPNITSVISMSSKVIPPGIVIRLEPSPRSLISTVRSLLLPSAPAFMPRPERLMASPSLTMSLRSSTADIQALSSETLASLKTLRRSTCLLSSVRMLSRFANVEPSVGSITAARIERSLPSAIPPSMISGPAMPETRWSPKVPVAAEPWLMIGLVRSPEMLNVSLPRPPMTVVTTLLLVPTTKKVSSPSRPSTSRASTKAVLTFKPAP